MELQPTPLQQTARGFSPDFLRPSWPSPDTRNCVFFMMTRSPSFHVSLPRLELGDTLLLGDRDEHQVISVEKLPWYTSTELTRTRLQPQNDEQWAKNRTLMHTNSHAKLLTVLTIDPRTTLGIGVTYPGWHAQPIPRPSLADDRRLSQGQNYRPISRDNALTISHKIPRKHNLHQNSSVR